MGYLGSDHIERFAAGKTVRTIKEANPSCHHVIFTDGSSLKLQTWMRAERSGNGYKMEAEVIATPISPGGEVVQSVEIMAGSQGNDAKDAKGAG